jgi:hypothetical protein
MQEKFDLLREKHPVFTFESFEIEDLADKLIITYNFNLGDTITFQPKWVLLKKHTDIDYRREEIFCRLVFNLGMVELVSYWKCACPPLVRIKAGYLDEEQKEWWKRQYFLGLGEFFYTNRIDTNIIDFMEIDVMAEPSASSYNNTLFEKTGCLIPIGGGKDSIVTMELLSHRKENNLCYMINKRDISIRCAKLAGYNDDEILIEKRTLDPTLLELNKEGYLNGHTPFSAVVAFSSVLAAYLFDKEYVVLSNEASANESTVEGTEVNHQYSKSYKFEQDFINYEKQYVASGVHYFSLLRPFSELQIARFFAKHRKYYTVFRSCNVGSKTDIWCCACPKCLFVFGIMSPFIDLEELADIFGSNMLEDESLIPIFDKLIGEAPEKPFECVGTRDELNTAICMAISKREAKGKELPKLYQYYKEKRLYRMYIGKNANAYFKYYNDENSVPTEFVNRLKNLMLDE